MISRLELLCDLNIICPCPRCAAFGDKIDLLADALEAGDLIAVTDGDSTVGLAITAQGREHMQPVLPWGATA